MNQVENQDQYQNCSDSDQSYVANDNKNFISAGINYSQIDVEDIEEIPKIQADAVNNDEVQDIQDQIDQIVISDIQQDVQEGVDDSIQQSYEEVKVCDVSSAVVSNVSVLSKSREQRRIIAQHVGINASINHIQMLDIIESRKLDMDFNNDCLLNGQNGYFDEFDDDDLDRATLYLQIDRQRVGEGHHFSMLRCYMYDTFSVSVSGFGYCALSAICFSALRQHGLTFDSDPKNVDELLAMLFRAIQVLKKYVSQVAYDDLMHHWQHSHYGIGPGQTRRLCNRLNIDYMDRLSNQVYYVLEGDYVCTYLEMQQNQLLGGIISIPGHVFGISSNSFYENRLSKLTGTVMKVITAGYNCYGDVHVNYLTKQSNNVQPFSELKMCKQSDWNKSLMKQYSFDNFGRVKRNDDTCIPYFGGKLILVPDDYCFLNSLCQLIDMADRPDFSLRDFVSVLRGLHNGGLIGLDVFQRYVNCYKIPVVSYGMFVERPSLVLYKQGNLVHVMAFVNRRGTNYKVPDQVDMQSQIIPVTIEVSGQRTACKKVDVSSRQIFKPKLNSQKPRVSKDINFKCENQNATDVKQKQVNYTRKDVSQRVSGVISKCNDDIYQKKIQDDKQQKMKNKQIRDKKVHQAKSNLQQCLNRLIKNQAQCITSEQNEVKISCQLQDQIQHCVDQQNVWQMPEQYLPMSKEFRTSLNKRMSRILDCLIYNVYSPSFDLPKTHPDDLRCRNWISLIKDKMYSPKLLLRWYPQSLVQLRLCSMFRQKSYPCWWDPDGDTVHLNFALKPETLFFGSSGNNILWCSYNAIKLHPSSKLYKQFIIDNEKAFVEKNLVSINGISSFFKTRNTNYVIFCYGDTEDGDFVISHQEQYNDHFIFITFVDNHYSAERPCERMRVQYDKHSQRYKIPFDMMVKGKIVGEIFEDTNYCFRLPMFSLIFRQLLKQQSKDNICRYKIPRDYAMDRDAILKLLSRQKHKYVRRSLWGQMRESKPKKFDLFDLEVQLNTLTGTFSFLSNGKVYSMYDESKEMELIRIHAKGVIEACRCDFKNVDIPVYCIIEYINTIIYDGCDYESDYRSQHNDVKVDPLYDYDMLHEDYKMILSSQKEMPRDKVKNAIVSSDLYAAFEDEQGYLCRDVHLILDEKMLDISATCENLVEDDEWGDASGSPASSIKQDGILDQQQVVDDSLAIILNQSCVAAIRDLDLNLQEENMILKAIEDGQKSACQVDNQISANGDIQEVDDSFQEEKDQICRLLDCFHAEAFFESRNIFPHLQDVAPLKQDMNVQDLGKIFTFVNGYLEDLYKQVTDEIQKSKDVIQSGKIQEKPKLCTADFKCQTMDVSAVDDRQIFRKAICAIDPALPIHDQDEIIDKLVNEQDARKISQIVKKVILKKSQMQSIPVQDLDISYPRQVLNAGKKVVSTVNKKVQGFFDVFKKLVIKYNVYGINQAAERQLGYPMILAIHDVNNNSLKADDTQSVKGLYVKGFNESTAFQVAAQGALSRPFLQVLSKYGVNVSKKWLEENTNQCGGHANLRLSMNLTIAGGLQRMMDHIYRLGLDKEDNDVYVIIDVGSKFKSIQGLLHEYLRKKHSPKMALDKNGNYVETEETKKITMSYKKRRILFYPIRPNVNQYDRVYYNQNIEAYQNFTSEYISFNKPFEGTIQEFHQSVLGKTTCENAVDDNIKIFMTMFDVHYYLPNYVPPFKCDMIISGGEFYPYVGQYDLPCREGQYVVYNKMLKNGKYESRIAMKTQAQGTTYEHPLVAVRDHMFCVNFGWYQHFLSYVVFKIGDPSPIVDVLVPNDDLLPGKSVQADYMYQIYSQIDKQYQTITQNIQYYKKNQMMVINKEKQLVVRYRDKSCYDEWLNQMGSHTAQDFKYGQVHNFFNVIQYSDIRNLKLSVPSDQYQMHAFQKFLKQVSCGFMRGGAVFDIQRKKDDIVQINDPQILFGRVGKILPVYQLMMNKSIPEMDRTDYIKIQTIENVIDKINVKQKLVSRPLKYFEHKKYFFCKPLLVEHIRNSRTLNKFVQIKDPLIASMIDMNHRKILKWMKKYPKPVQNKKNQLVPLVEESTCYPTGLTVLKGGESQIEYEWSSKCVQNQIYAVNMRLFASQPMPDNEVRLRYENMCTRWMKWMRQQLLKCDWSNARITNPFDWLDNKDDFDQGKKIKYRETILKQMKNPKVNYLSSYMSMVKSGETYYATELKQDENDCLIGRPDRPRNVCVPANSGCGLLTWIQSLCWDNIKQILPGFIQGCTKEQLKYKFIHAMERMVQNGLRVVNVSTDNSAFESSQQGWKQRAVDNPLWMILIPIIVKELKQNPWFKDVDLDLMENSLIRDLTNNDYFLFVNIPDICSDEWPDRVINIWNRDFSRSHGVYGPEVLKNYICYGTDGITLSGDVVHTTMGNTARTQSDQFFYLEQIGYVEPWLNDHKGKFMTAAAGDDSVFLLDESDAIKLKEVVLQLTARSKDDKIYVGLAQIISEVVIKPWHDIDFCSKWSFCDGNPNNWNLYRDVYKTLSTKHYYTRQNDSFKCYPLLHIKAMQVGFQSEKISRLVEDIFQYRFDKWSQMDDECKKDFDVSHLKIVYDRLKYTFDDQSEEGYLYESAINDRLKLNYYDLLNLIFNDYLCLGSSKFIQQQQQFLIKQEMQNNSEQQEKKDKVIKKVRQKIKRQVQQSGESTQKKYGQFEAEKGVIDGKKDYTYDQIRQKQCTAEFEKYVASLDQKLKGRTVYNLLSLVGQKTAQKLEKSFKDLSVQDKKKVLVDIIADDLSPETMEYISKKAPVLLNHVWNLVTKTSPAKYLLERLNSLLGVDLNDNCGGYNAYTYNASLRKEISWSDMDPESQNDLMCFDGTCVQSICSVLFPEYEKCRFPSNSGTKTGLYSRVNSYTITTNAAGNAIVIVFPDLIASTTTFPSFINIYNDASLNINTATQTPDCTGIAGPMQGLSGYNQLRVTGCSVNLQSIVSQLNNQGRVVTIMNNSAFSGTAKIAVASLDSARDREYVVYTSFQNINGHRAVYVNNNNVPGEFGVSSSDFIAILITGAQASAQVLQMNVNYNVEYTISPGSISEISAPPLGPFTLQCLSTAISRKPDLRILGDLESKQLYANLMTTRNRYQDCLQTLLTYDQQPKYDNFYHNPGFNMPQAGFFDDAPPGARGRGTRG